MIDITETETDIPVLFLDLDGVLHPQPCPDSDLFSRVPILEDVLRPFPDWEVVISSSWRLQMPLMEIRSHLPESLAKRVVDITPDGRFESLLGRPPTLGQHTHGVRQIEIEAWLRQHRAGGGWRTRYAALDDWPYNFCSPTPPWVVLCDPAVGLDEGRAQRLMEWMRG